MDNELSDDQIFQLADQVVAERTPRAPQSPAELSDEDIFALADQVVTEKGTAAAMKRGGSLSGMPAPGMDLAARIMAPAARPAKAPKEISDSEVFNLADRVTGKKALPAPSTEEIAGLRTRLGTMQQRSSAGSTSPERFIPPTDMAGVERQFEGNRANELARLTSDYLAMAEVPEGFLGGLKKTVTGEGGWKKALPFIGGLSSAVSKMLRNELLEKMKKGEPLSEDEQTTIDAMALASRRMAQEPEFWTKVGELTGASLPYAAEFATTGGIYRGAKTAMGAALANAPKAVRSLVPKLAGVGAQVAAGGPTRIADNYYDRMARDWNVDPGTLSAVISDKDQDKSVIKALAGSVGDQYIEFLSERTGKYLGKGIEKVTPDKVKQAVVKLFRVGAIEDYLKKHEGATVIEAFKALGNMTSFDGVPGEVFEEYVGAGLRSITGVDEQNPALQKLLQGDVPAAVGEFLSSLPIKDTPAMAVSFGLIPLSKHAAALGTHAVVTAPEKVRSALEERRIANAIPEDLSTPEGRAQARNKDVKQVVDFDAAQSPLLRGDKIPITTEQSIPFPGPDTSIRCLY